MIDATSKTSLLDEYLLNANGHLEIHQVFAFADKAIKRPKVFAIANHPQAEGFDSLLSKKNVDLKKQAAALGVSDDVDKRSNSALRKSILENVRISNSARPNCSWTRRMQRRSGNSYPNTCRNMRCSGADRPSTDEDAEVQDPLKFAIGQAIKEVQEELNTVKEKVRERALDVAGRTLTKLADFDKALASELNPHFKADPKWEGVFKLALTGDDEIPINKRGSGVRRLVLFSFFRAEAERLREVNDKGNIIYAVEEPETAQHPATRERWWKHFERLRSLTAARYC
ncbi:MAG: AAA family ATPase [Opitutaceae bacterium]